MPSPHLDDSEPGHPDRIVVRVTLDDATPFETLLARSIADLARAFKARLLHQRQQARRPPIEPPSPAEACEPEDEWIHGDTEENPILKGESNADWLRRFMVTSTIRERAARQPAPPPVIVRRIAPTTKPRAAASRRTTRSPPSDDPDLPPPPTDAALLWDAHFGDPALWRRVQREAEARWWYT